MIKLKIEAVDGADLRLQLLALLGESHQQVQSILPISNLSIAVDTMEASITGRDLVIDEPKKTRTRRSKAEIEAEAAENANTVGTDNEEPEEKGEGEPEPEVKKDIATSTEKKITIDEIRAAVMDCRNIPAKREASKELIEKYCGDLEAKVSNIPESKYWYFLSDIKLL
jgi:hypothetical protein